MSFAAAGSSPSAFHGTAVTVFASALETFRTPMTFVDGISFTVASFVSGTMSVQMRYSPVGLCRSYRSPG